MQLLLGSEINSTSILIAYKPSAMLKTTIRGFLVASSIINETLGSCSEELLLQIFKNQSELIDECDFRLRNSFTEERTPLKAREAIEAIIYGNLLEQQAMEGACVFETIINEIASPLDDRSEHNSLWCNTAFSLEDFNNIFEVLQLHTLNDNWQRFTLKLTPKGFHSEWPIWTQFKQEQINRCIDEFGSLNIKKAISTLSPEILNQTDTFEQNDVLQEIMSENLLTLKEWFQHSQKNKEDLLILFDGDFEPVPLF